MGVKLCKSTYIFSWATVTVYIYTVTVARLSLKKIILSVRYKNFIFALFFLSPLTEHTNASLKSQLLSPSWVLPLIFTIWNFFSFSSPSEIIMWSVWEFCSLVRRVDQLTDEIFSIDRLWGKFSKKVWVFLIEILGFFFFFWFQVIFLGVSLN